MPTIAERIEEDIKTAMKAREEAKLTTLRMVKSAIRSKEIDKREPLTDAEQQAALPTMLKQRRDSLDQFTKGNRPELAAKEQAEIDLIDAYMPQAASQDEICAIVMGAIAHIAKDSNGQRPGPKDMGPTMNVVRQRILASGVRADGKLISDMVKAELAKGA